MVYTRSSKQPGSLSTLNSKPKQVTSCKTDKGKMKILSSSGRPVLIIKNQSNTQKPEPDKPGQNVPFAFNKKNETVCVCKSPSLGLRNRKHKGLDKNQSGLQTVINKENMINPKILGIFESHYKTKCVQVRNEQEKEQTVLNKRGKTKKLKVDNDEEKINSESFITKVNKIKSKIDQNKNLSIISVDKENTGTMKNKSLNLDKDAISKPNPVWKMCPNDTQKSKKRTVDVYDITEDEDLKKEGFSKKKKLLKQNISKVKNIKGKTKKNFNKQCHQNKVLNSEIKALSNKNQTKSCNILIPLTCSNIKNIVNNVEEKIALQKPDFQLRNEKKFVETLDEVAIIDQTLDEVSSIVQHQQIHKNATIVKETKLDLKQTLKKATNIDPGKQMHREATPVRDTQPNSKQTSTILNNKEFDTSELLIPQMKQTLKKATNIDPGKQMRREVTPVRETQLNSKQTSNILNNQEFDTQEKVLIPQMTSTPESDICSSTTPYVTLGNSFFARMSEIPAIPVITSNLETDNLDDELLYSDKPICSPVKISLFESPIKIDESVKKPTTVKLKQMKLNAFVEPSMKTTENIKEYDRDKDLINHSWDLFCSPAKKKNNQKSIKKLETSSRESKGKKPRNSYENRDKIRVNIADWKKTSSKEKSAAEEKEEELVKSLNEHFSELETFELCID